MTDTQKKKRAPKKNPNRHNMTKFQILTVLHKFPKATSAQIARRIRKPIDAVRPQLSHYIAFDYIQKQPIAKGQSRFAYTLTPKGERTLTYILQRFIANQSLRLMIRENIPKMEWKQEELDFYDREYPPESYPKDPELDLTNFLETTPVDQLNRVRSRKSYKLPISYFDDGEDYNFRGGFIIVDNTERVIYHHETESIRDGTVTVNLYLTAPTEYSKAFTS